MENKNNKVRAGEKKKPPWKRAGLSMEFKSKTLAASFKKAECDESDYDDYGGNADVFEEGLSAELPAAVCIGSNKEKNDICSEIDENGSMDCLKNAAKASAKVAESSSRASWMKDKVSNLLSRKGKQEETEMSENTRQSESDQNYFDNSSMSKTLGDGSSSNEKTPLDKQSASPLKEKKDLLDGLSVEIKDGNKEKRQGRATTGWIRDQVSSLITKGKNYASGGVTLSEATSSHESPAVKRSPTQQRAAVEKKDAKSSLAQSINEHYSLSQKVEGQELVELKTEGAVSVNFGNNEMGPNDEPHFEGEKFPDIHESINKSISKQTMATFSKEEPSAHNLDDKPSSSQASNSIEIKKPSTKSKIKGFLSPKPLTTDLTHIPLSPSSKDDKGKNGGHVAAHTQTKMKFKFSGKLSFSELLQSQEHGSAANGNDLQNNESLSSSPVLDRFQEQISEDEDDDCGIDIVKKDEATSSNTVHGSTTFFRLWCLSVFFYALYILPLNSFISGVFLGALSMYLIGCLVIWLFCPSGKSFEQYRQELKKYLKEAESVSSVSKSHRNVDPENLRKPKDLKVIKFSILSNIDIG